MTLKGTGRVIIGEDSFDVFPDTTVVIPVRVTRQMVNTGAEDLVFLIIRSLTTPPEKTALEIEAGHPWG